jgi:hypothetical protein
MLSMNMGILFTSIHVKKKFPQPGGICFSKIYFKLGKHSKRREIQDFIGVPSEISNGNSLMGYHKYNINDVWRGGWLWKLSQAVSCVHLFLN